MAIKKYYVTVNVLGNTRWYKDAKCKVLHRENGPAVDCTSGHKEWWQNGKLHRTDDPAIVFEDGDNYWYIKGKRMTEAEFLAARHPVVELTVADIEKLVGKRVKIVE